MHVDELLFRAVVILAASVGVVFLSARIRVPPIVGLILTGIVVGPSGLALVGAVEEVEALAEIGVVLLLFIIGLELSVGQLREMGRPFLLGGGTQALLTTAATAGLMVLWNTPWTDALFVGWVVTLSSTAVVLKLYGQRRETQTPQGRSVLGILLFQDLLIVPLIVLTPVLAGTERASPLDLAIRFGGSLAAVAGVVVLARFAMPWLLHRLVATRVRELFILASLLACLGLSYFTFRLGFSLALGAFLAGILISETEYSHQVIADIVPFRDVFASLFFVSIGMLVDLEFALERLPMLVALALGVVVLKTLLAAGAVLAVGYPVRIAVIGGLSLAQIGEFSFVLMEVGRANGMLGGGAYQTILVAAVLTLLVTPGLVTAAPALGRRAAELLRRRDRMEGDPTVAGLSSHVIIVGYGLNGSLLARVLGETGIPHLVIELNGATVKQAQHEGVPILFGDASRREILEHAGIDRAEAVVFAISDLEAVRRGVSVARELNGGVAIIVRTRMVQEIEPLRAAGATEVVAEEFESAIEIFTLVLERLHVPRNVIRAQTRVLQGEGYRVLRVPGAPGASEAVLEALEAGTTDLYRIGADSQARGRTLEDLHLRRRTGASVIAVVRGEKSFPNPSPIVTLEEGDTLVLVGSHGEIDAAFRLLEGDASVEDQPA